MIVSPSLDGRRFRRASEDVLYAFREDRLTSVVTGTYSGGSVVAGSFVGSRDGARVELRYAEALPSGLLASGEARLRVEVLEDGRVRLHETWSSSSGSGESVLEELPGPRWVRSRVARPVASLSASVAFYEGLLGLLVMGSFQDHAGYDGVFLALPGGGELELTTGVVVPTAPDDLLCLYLDSSASVAALDAALPASVPRVQPQNPYWADYGVTLLDPDGYRVVLTSPPGS